MRSWACSLRQPAHRFPEQHSSAIHFTKTQQHWQAMHQRMRTIVILVTAAVYAGFAVWLGVSPASLLGSFGIEQSTPAMLTEIRAFYGGIEIGIALVMLILWKQGLASASLLVGGLPLAGSASGRMMGMLIDGFSWLHLVLAAVEFLGCAACLVAYYAAKNDPTPAP